MPNMLIDFQKNHKLYFKQMDIDKRICLPATVIII